jgi:hypothetical protein
MLESITRSSGPPLTRAEPNSHLLGQPRNSAEPSTELRKVFDEFVGQTFYGQMISAMRTTVGKPAYFHGGRMEEVFQGQLDQALAEKLSEASASQFTEPLFRLFTMSRR